jgi:hypothetical protein
VAERNDARGFGDAATVAFAVGAAATAAGLVLWLTAPHESREGSARVRLQPTAGGAALAGEW